MSKVNFLILLMLVAVNSAASLMVKKGASAIVGGAQLNGEVGLFKMITQAINPYTVFGLMMLGIGFVIYIALASRMQISILQPGLALAYIFVLFGAYWFFNEPLDAQKLIGTAVIIFGVYLVSSSIK